MTYRGIKVPVDEALRIIYASGRLPDPAKEQIELVLWRGNHDDQVQVLMQFINAYPEIVVAGVRE